MIVLYGTVIFTVNYGVIKLVSYIHELRMFPN